FRTGRAQVHEVDACQQQYKSADDAEEPNDLNSAARDDAILPFRSQVPVLHGMQGELGVDGDITLIPPHVVQDRVPDLIGSGFKTGVVADRHVDIEIVVGEAWRLHPGADGNCQVERHKELYVMKIGV